MHNYELYIELCDRCHLADKVDGIEIDCILGSHRETINVCKILVRKSEGKRDSFSSPLHIAIMRRSGSGS